MSLTEEGNLKLDIFTWQSIGFLFVLIVFSVKKSFAPQKSKILKYTSSKELDIQMTLCTIFVLIRPDYIVSDMFSHNTLHIYI